MRRYLRYRVPGGTYFFTLVTHERRPILTTSIARRALGPAIWEVRHRWPFHVVAIVLLPDHFRAVCELPPDDADYSVDQAIELLLKEKVRSAGRSIYKNPKETITIWGAYDILEKELSCSVAEKPDLELLHEERNNIQHKYANPSADDAAFHIEKAMLFIRRFLKDELNLDLVDFIPSEYLEQVIP
jgi:REP element-mobilizing transposase RayT